MLNLAVVYTGVGTWHGVERLIGGKPPEDYRRCHGPRTGVIDCP